ncbi:MAG: DUF4838 domain-containing protein [Lentisphaerae bacterium]|nr:DUF4838 domain-containing protein [Lentisphaerota bacterium]
MTDKFLCGGVAMMLALSTSVVRGAEGEEDEFTASPERRVELLAGVRARDRGRDAAKAKGPTVTIVENGQPAATIVAEPVPGRYAIQPAKVLQEWVKLMSGAELPIATDDPGAGVRIYVGKTAEAAGLKLSDIESRSGEGLRVKCDGKNIYIAGQCNQATVRAVGRFLEEEFGCRWFADPDWGRHYPEAKTLKVRKGEFAETPGSIYRRIWGAEGAFRNQTWLAWAGDGGNAVPMAHSWGFLTKEDFEKHPDWFRLDATGKRVNGPWYNIGHPEVRKRFMEWALKASDNGHRAISFSPPDDHREDFSPESRAYDNPNVIEKSTGRISATDRFLSPVNEAANRLYKLDPKPIHGFYAYSDYTLPPTRPELQTLAPNLSIWIAPIRFSRYHPLGHPNSSTTQLLKEIVDVWSKTGAKIGWRGYNPNLAESLTPFSRITEWAYDMPYLHQKGAIGFSLETINAWEINGPHIYLSIRLAYDPRLDPWAIMADYWDKAYGPAAEAMEKYWMEVDAATIGLKTETGSRHALHHVYTPERLKQLDGLMTEAERLVKTGGTENQRERVDVSRRGLTRAFFWRKWYDAMNGGDLETAKKIYDEWYAFVWETRQKGHGNAYEEKYLRRFVGNNILSAYKVAHPTNAPAGRVVAVLPDLWKTATSNEIVDLGIKGNPWDVAYDDSGWKTIKTYTDTRNAQGLPEYFGTMWYRVNLKAPKSSKNLHLQFLKADRYVTLYINGKQVNAKEQEGFYGTGVDVTGHLKPRKDNQITVMIRHLVPTELFLGGLVDPVYVIEKGK